MALVRPNFHHWTISAFVATTLLLTWWLSQPALTGPFLFDDFPNFANLRQISGCISGDNLANYLASFTGTPGRPLAALSFLIDDYAWPSTPYGWKRTNLLVHLLCGIFVFGLTRTLAAMRLRPQASDWAALGVSAAWLIHPMQLSTSMLTVQRMTQLMTLISLGACWCVAHQLSIGKAGAREYAQLLVFTAFMSLLAFLCKENGALLPLYVAATSYWVLSNRPSIAFSTKATRLYFAGLLAPIAAIAAYLTAYAIRWHDDGLRPFNPWERLLTEARILWDYLRQILLPRLNGSGIFHDDIVISRGMLSPVTTLVSVIGLITVVALAAYKRRVWPLFVFASTWYIGGHAMESSTLPLELYFEHRNYLPMVGVLAATGIGIASITSIKLRRTAYIASITWLAMCGAMLWQAAPVWGSQHLLSRIWAREHPDSIRATEMLAKAQFEENDRLVARNTLLATIERGQEFGALAAHVLLIDCQSGRLTAQDIDWAAMKIQAAPFNRSTLDAMSILRDLITSGKCESPEALGAWIRAMKGISRSPGYQNNEIQGYISLELVRIGIHQRDFNMVMSNMKAAYHASPSPNLALAMGTVLESGGYPNEAKQWRLRAAAIQSPWPIPWWHTFKRLTGFQSNHCPTTK